MARALIEFPGNTEKGFAPRFLYIFPKSSYAHLIKEVKKDDRADEELWIDCNATGGTTTHWIRQIQH